MLPTSNNKTNQPEKTFNSLDWTAGAATALPTALSLYAFNAASKAETTPGKLFHTAIGLLSCKYAYGFASSWKENKTTTTKEQYFEKAFYNAENIQNAATGKVCSLFCSIISSSKKVTFQDIGKKVIEENKKGPIETVDPTPALNQSTSTNTVGTQDQIPKVDSWDTLNVWE